MVSRLPLTASRRSNRDWVIEYVDAWVERTAANGGILPTSVGLDGKIESGYGWYGGVYGWNHTVMQIPWKGQIAHRNSWVNRAHYGFANALLLTGDDRYVRPWRRMLDLVNENAKQQDGRTVYPPMYGRWKGRAPQSGAIRSTTSEEWPTGWYEFRPHKFYPAPSSCTTGPSTAPRSSCSRRPPPGQLPRRETTSPSASAP